MSLPWADADADINAEGESESKRTAFYQASTSLCLHSWACLQP